MELVQEDRGLFRLRQGVLPEEWFAQLDLKLLSLRSTKTTDTVRL